MSLVEHIEELRGHLLIVLAAWAAASLACWAFSSRLLDFLAAPVGSLVFLHPTEPFLVRLKISMVAGAFLAFPVLLERGWRFVSPGLKPSESRLAALLIFPAWALFCLGAAFGWFVAIPAGLKFLLGYAGPSLVAAVALDNYVTFVGTLLLAFGLMFELPMAVLVLARLGLVSPFTLACRRREVLLAIVVLSALLTPGPDIFSQAALSVPTYLLYEISVHLSRWIAPCAPIRSWEPRPRVSARG
jgi:sec-independent protein translocase protein TatC